MNSRDPSAEGEPLARTMPDVQRASDDRRLPIQRVGVRGLRYPLSWRTGERDMPTVAVWGLYVALPEDVKGTHMSRFVALLEGSAQRMSLDGLPALHARMLELLEAEHGRIELAFPLFVSKTAPVSGVDSLLDYDVSIDIDGGRHQPAMRVRVVVPVTSLCPCSKSVAEYGAHNQRSHVTITVHSDEPITPEALLRVAEEEASSEIYGLLKRVDEKYITERAYDNPKFVEDLVRDVAARLKADARIAAFTVEAENFESIHNHSAYARIDHPLPA